MEQSNDPDDSATLATYVESWLRSHGNTDDAVHMNRYMKIDVRGDPCRLVGVKKSTRKALNREIKRRFKPTTNTILRAHVAALWAIPIREARYTAAEFAGFWIKRIHLDALPQYEMMIREGQWWDLVDIVACRVTTYLHLAQPSVMRPVLERWIEDGDFWIRRTALLSQLKSKAQTDPELLFRHCYLCSHETEFFIRKAIGWALREYSKVAPEAVRAFLLYNKHRLSGLSFREGAKLLVRSGQM